MRYSSNGLKRNWVSLGEQSTRFAFFEIHFAAAPR